MKKKRNYSRFNSDENIRDMFQNFHVPYDDQSWNSLAQKLDTAPQFVTLPDSEIKQDLSTISIPYNSASWDVLEKRLELYDNRKKWILRGKIVELTMFFFLFYFFAVSFTEIFEHSPTSQELAVNDSRLPSKSNTDPSKLSNIHAELTEKDQAPIPDSDTDARKYESKTVDNAQIVTKNNSGQIFENRDGSLSLIAPTKDQQISTQVNGNWIKSESPETVSAENAPLLLDKSMATMEGNHTRHVDMLNHLPLLISKVDTDKQLEEELQLPNLYPGNFNDKKISFLIGAVIGYDKDLIKSPFPHQKSEVMLGRIEDNFRMGLNLAMDMNAIELSAGVHYLIKNYKSVYAGENQVRIASIPVMLKLKLPFAGFMRGYVSGGVSGNYVIHANYQEHDYFRDRPQLDFIENNTRGAGYSLLSSTNYKNGIFEGETVRGNHFYTANIAIGLEAHLNKTYSLFFEQAYSHHLKGSAIGPAFDHFFSSTSLMGLRYRILKNSNRILHSKTGNTYR